MKVSVLICCANSEHTLPAALASVRWADEVVVVDSGSTDRTAEIAREGAHVYRLQPWLGYRDQKMVSIEWTRNDWVLIVDGDEEVSHGLVRKVQSLDEETLRNVDVVYMRRRNWVMGRPVRAWWPDWQSRLIHRRRVVWPEEALHDARKPGEPSRVLHLKEHLEHKRVGAWSFADYFGGSRLDSRLLPVARQMFAGGKRVGGLGLWLRPKAAFWKFFIFKLGFLDGTFGLLIAQKAAVSVQLKYAALWAVQEEARRAGGCHPDKADG